MLKIIYYVDKAIEYFLAVIRKLKFTLFFNLHYSQNGEDAVLYRAFPKKYKGFYVDVGAHHPMRFSNTYYFYKLGWNGINIDASSTFSNDFSKIRSRDINLNFGVSDTEEVLDYFMFKEAAYNSFKAGIKEKPQISKNTEFIGVKKVALRRLDNILDEYLPKNTKIDFLSIDVEEYDLNVLKSNNWKLYRPLCVLVEDNSFSFLKMEQSAVYNFLININYELRFRVGNTLIFFDSNDKTL